MDRAGFIRIGVAAKMLRVSVDTVRRWEKAGEITSYRLDGKNRYFRTADISKLISCRPLRISQAARQLGVSVSTVRRLESRGVLCPERDNAGRRLYDKNVVLRLTKKN